jgi:Fe-S oxidoreductase
MLLLYHELKPFIFALFFLGAMGAFARSTWRLARLARLGKDRADMFRDPVDRFGQVIYLVFFQRKVLGDRFGWNHAIFFWGFLVIFVGHIEFIMRGIFPWFTLSFLGDFAYGWIVRGGDVMAGIVLVAVGLAVFRRIVVRPKHIDNLSTDAFRILGMIGNVMVTYFLATAFAIRGGHPDVAHIAGYLPFSTFFSGFFSGVVAVDAAGLWYEMFWWAHAVVLFSFLNYIPHSKHLHLLGAIPNIYVHERTKHRAALTKLDFEASEVWGVGKVTDFTWKGLLDTYACTECGRCDLYCPANNTRKPLKPQAVIHDMKDNLMINGDAILATRGVFEFTAAPADFEPSLPLIANSEETRQKGQTSPEVLWACTSCGACVNACPVLIDHVDAIMDMRRHMTLMMGNVSPELANTFKNIENNYNPWGIGADKRADWAEGLGLHFWGGSADAERFEYLFWVGCAGSYDNRAQKTMKALTQILEQGGVTYAILGTSEKCTGDSARRTGNEYLFDAMAKENVQTLNDFGVKKIVTACPHCFNTLKNEYPAFGGHYEVVHHTQLIDELIGSGRITLSEEMMKKVTFHDPCFLGRWNDETEAPRRSLAAVRHLSLVEMEAHGAKSFCCGAGGGQMWMEEDADKRVNVERTRQALAVEPEVIAVACPFCMTMIEDGVKHHGAEDVKVMDVAEVVAAAMDTTVAPKPRAAPKTEHVHA